MTKNTTKHIYMSLYIKEITLVKINKSIESLALSHGMNNTENIKNTKLTKNTNLRLYSLLEKHEYYSGSLQCCLLEIVI